MVSTIVSTDDLGVLIKSIAPSAQVDDEYARFLQPSQSDIEALLAKHWQPGAIQYGSIAEDWPLCYDFADICAAVVRMAAYREGWPMRPAFGVLRYTKTTVVPDPDSVLPPIPMVPSRHAINFAVLDDCHVRYFEPQTGEWMDEPVDLKSLDSLYI